MTVSSEIYEFFLSNIQKIVIPEELINLEMSLSRFELVTLITAEKIENVTMSILAQRIGVPVSTATGIVDRLVKKGLLERGRSEEDRRVVAVTLTENGKKVNSDVDKHVRQLVAKVRDVITEDEFETVFRIIKKVVLGLQISGKGQVDPKHAGLTKDPRNTQRKSIRIE